MGNIHMKKLKHCKIIKFNEDKFLTLVFFKPKPFYWQLFFWFNNFLFHSIYKRYCWRNWNIFKDWLPQKLRNWNYQAINKKYTLTEFHTYVHNHCLKFPRSPKLKSWYSSLYRVKMRWSLLMIRPLLQRISSGLKIFFSATEYDTPTYQ